MYALLSPQYTDVSQDRCGECGDNWSDPRPRANDEGGKYGKGIIAATYSQAQVINVQIQSITVDSLNSASAPTRLALEI